MFHRPLLELEEEMSSLSFPVLILALKLFSSIYQISPNNIDPAYLLHPTKTPNDLTYPSNSLAVSVEQSQPLPCTVPDNQTTFVMIGTLCLLGKKSNILFTLPYTKARKLRSYASLKLQRTNPTSDWQTGVKCRATATGLAKR